MKKALSLVLVLITLSIGGALAEIHPGYWQGGPVYPNGAREYDLMLTYNGYEDSFSRVPALHRTQCRARHCGN